MKTLTSLPIAFLLFTSSLICGQTTVLDSTFGNGGKVITQISSPDNIIALAEQADGKIVACGEHHLVRYNTDGSLDTNFGSNGIIDSLGFIAFCMKKYPSGEILIGGTSDANFSSSVLAKFLSNGQPDTTFGVNGNIMPVGSIITSLAIKTNGKIVAGGVSSSQWGVPPSVSWLSLLNTDGSLDNFHPNWAFPILIDDLFILSDGKILAGGGSNSSYTLVKVYPHDLNLDTTYANNGITSISGQYGLSYGSFRSDGSIQIVSEYWTPSWIWGSHYSGLDSIGVQDTVFNNIDTSLINQNTWYKAIAIDANGKSFVAGYNYSNSNFILNKLDEYAERDTLCFPSISTDFGGNDEAHAMIITSDGKILLAGKSDSSFALARYIDPCSGISIKEELPTASLVVFPNPSSGSFSVQFDAAIHTGQIQIYNLNGQKVYHQKIDGQNEIELKLQLPDGFYILRLSSENTNYTQRLLINQNR